MQKREIDAPAELLSAASGRSQAIRSALDSVNAIDFQ